MPFWMRHAVDPSGPINNCIDDTGKVLSRDRFVWSQGRALWTFSALWNRVEQRREWLEVAHGLNRWLLRYGRNSEGLWVYRLNGDDQVVEGPKSIYVDGFALCGLVEYIRATRDSDAIRVATETWESVRDRLARPGSYPIAPFHLAPGLKALGVNMVFAWVFHELAKVLERPEISKAALGLATEVLRDFEDREHGMFREFVRIGGGVDDSNPETRVCVPGHVIETMWFLIALFEDYPEHADKIHTCCRVIQRHLELAWDEPSGGLRLAMDATGREPIGWANPDCKAWWPQIEAMVATAYAWKHTRADWCRQWHVQLRDYAYARFPVSTGEWRQCLDRQGKHPAPSVLPVKDPFHLPRALMTMITVFENGFRHNSP